MPVFEYQCDRCGRLFDVFTQRRDDAARVLSTFASQASGGGCSPIGGG